MCYRCQVGVACVGTIQFRYDADYDVLYLLVEPPVPAAYDEVAPGILIRQSDEEECVGAVVIGFSQKEPDLIRQYVPLDIDWEQLRKICSVASEID